MADEPLKAASMPEPSWADCRRWWYWLPPWRQRCRAVIASGHFAHRCGLARFHEGDHIAYAASPLLVAWADSPWRSALVGSDRAAYTGPYVQHGEGT